MARDRKHLPQPSDAEVQDFRLVQVLHESRRSALARDGDAWESLAGSLGRILGLIGEPAEPSSGEMGMDRIDRPSIVLDASVSSRVVGALMALADRPDEHHLELAQSAVDDLEDGLS